MVSVRKTKKGTKTSKAKTTNSTKETTLMTVPELRRAFEHIHALSNKGASVTEFRKEWKKVFGTELSEKAASEYLDFVTKNKTTQKGGAQTMSPASLGYEMAPGQGTPSVPAYVAGGFPLPSDSVYKTCGTNPFLPPAESMGSNAVTHTQKGGKRTRKAKKQQGGAFPTLQTAFSEFMQRPFAMNSPPSAGNDLMMLQKGYNQFSSPRPEINTPYIPQGTTIYNASIAPVSKLF
jgi:hypothetical protein